MTAPNTSRFINNKFVARVKYDQVFAERDSLSEQMLEAIKALAECVELPEIAEFLRAHWKAPRDVALRIAVGSGGCVRAAMADLETWLDVEGGGLL